MCMSNYNSLIEQVKIYDEISQVSKVASNLWEVDQCFGASTLQWLVSIAENNENKFAPAYLKKRLELQPNSADFARLNGIGLDLIDPMSEISGNDLQLAEVKFWIDLPGFGCQRHSDASELFVSYQVYLASGLWEAVSAPDFPTEQREFIFSTSQQLIAKGARFWHVSGEHGYQALFKPNHGYINLNSDAKIHDVPGSFDTRTSVMFQFSRV